MMKKTTATATATTKKKKYSVSRVRGASTLVDTGIFCLVSYCIL